MANGDTVERILRAATILFAERGFAETSLRTITGMADVNLAAVNYHFGTKKSLIQAVFSQFLSPFCRELERRLNDMESSLSPGQVPGAERLLRILIDSLTESVHSINEKPQRFMRLLGLAYTQSQQHLRTYLSHTYGSTYNRYIGWLKRTQPGLDPIVFYWRLNFILGASIFTLGSFESIQAILREDHQEETDMRQALVYLVDALTGLLNSPTSEKTIA
ncbi:TetR/AcrR family transcriptional regulator [Saccharophagus sp. K07]|jgi:AcrR family transcriptional regulator|uniref:TetR/AcrR family transcriptional regulator n=1 Tax=Saccharophagus sp. K07 TaxID=2283636 RepID=UPI0016523BC0|nr:TetR/AcrR family transcriptional regulator [Saccharophagus sp. K07]MBC6904937.1 TetR/AcrR family transcriptional regulator [Saccharophagus sp. K07]